MTGTAASGVGTDRDPRHGHDRVDVGFAHAIDDDGDVETVGDERVERQVGRVCVRLLG